MSVPKRNHLDEYEVYWYGPGSHESHKKSGGLNLLSLYISEALRKEKRVTQPPSHKVMITFRNDPTYFGLFQRHPKTVWLSWDRDYRDLEGLSLDASNNAIGEFSIQIASDLMKKIRRNPAVINDFPFEVVERAIEDFRSSGYSFKSKFGPTQKFDASPLTARFFNDGNCLGTRTTMVIFLGKTELHRRVISEFGPGRWDLTKYEGIFDLYDNQIKFFSVDVLREPTAIEYADLPDEVQKHLPTNEELHAEWDRQDAEQA